MPDDKPAPAKPKRRFRWLRRMVWTLAIFVLLLIAFHRPLILDGGRWAAIHFAKQANLNVDLRLGGTLYDSFTISNISATATGPSVVRDLHVGLIEVRYSIPDLIHKGVSDVLKAVVVRDVKAVIDPSQAPPATPPAKPAASKEGGPIQIPPWIPRLIELRNIDVVNRSPAGDLNVQGFTFTLLPDQPGELKLQHLSSPATGTFENISAATQFRDKNFELRGLAINPDISTSLINLDASHIDQDEIGVKVEGDFFGGHTALTSHLHNIRKAATADLDLALDNLSLDRVGTLLKQPLHGSLQHLSVKFAGDPTSPPTWTGNVALGLDKPGHAANVADKVGLSLTLAGGKLEVPAVTVEDGQTTVHLDANATLPATLAELAKTPAKGHFAVNCPDIAEAATKAGAASAGVAGKATVQGNFDLNTERLTADVSVDGDNITQAANQVTKALVKLSLTKKMPAQGAPLDGLETKTSVTLSGLKSGAYQAEEVTLEAVSSGSKVELHGINVHQQGNEVHLSGSYLLPQDLAKAAEGQAEANFNISAPNLTAFAPELKGTVRTSGSVSQKDGKRLGQLKLDASSLGFRQISIQQAQANITLSDKDVKLDSLEVHLQDDDYVRAQGAATLNDDIPYSGTFSAKVKDLAVFQPVLKAAGRTEKVAGSFNLEWKGSGQAKQLKNTGDISLAVHNAMFGNITGIQYDIGGTYSHGLVDIPKFSLASSLGSASTRISFKDSKLEIKDLAISQGPQHFATAQIAVPLDMTKTSDPMAIVPPTAPISVHVVSNKLDLKKLAEQFHLPPQGSGFVTASIDVGGSLSAIDAALKVKGEELESPALKKVKAAFNLDLTLKDKKADLKAVISQPTYLPVTITGHVPVDLQKIMADKKIDMSTPLDVAVKMPRTSASFVPTLAPAVRYVEGDAAIDVKAGGTLEKPVFSGDAMLNLPTVRFANAQTPALADVKVAMAFTNDTLKISQIHGEIGGGPFDVSGLVKLAKPAEPEFDIRVKADHLAVMRNDSITVRINSDLKIAGPLKGGEVSGTVAVVDSRFFRDIDILPISLPGRPKNKPKTKKTESSKPPPPPVRTQAAPRPSVGGPPFTLPPPLSDWKFNIKVKSANPFLVRGNLAKGSSTIDLVLDGPGSSPALNGSVRLEKLTALLPFSKLNIENGYVYFTPDTGLDPRLEIQAESTIRSYVVKIYISGPASNPETSMTSEPPLEQEDIVSLLATGTTTKELGDNPDMLAGRAAALVFQKLYHSVFKEKDSDEDQKSVLDRFQVDTAGVGRDGSQAVNATFSLSDNFQLIGQVDLEGNVGGEIKYVMRFR